ncbi:hypothetical protein [Rhizobium oryziradicis]|uniref:hypothetical protein n=1 Tax=Rhizobium oryziradicis TaxID=1867956 RepID=UPI0015881DAD|nr:hypothetical protein [Rhizobium oryziradicis]
MVPANSPAPFETVGWRNLNELDPDLFQLAPPHHAMALFEAIHQQIKIIWNIQKVVAKKFGTCI